MTAARPVTAGCVRVERGRRSAWLWGPGVAHAVEAVGARSMRCPVRRTLTVPLADLPDVLVYLEHVDRRHVIVVEVDGGAVAGPVPAAPIDAGEVVRP
jgi:hypothetical protein